MPIFPAKKSCRLRYSTNCSFSSASGVVASYVFSANGLFDPDITGTGHQPMGFDQMMLSYNHYCVTDARIRCTFKNTTGSTLQVACAVTPSATPSSVIDTILEFGGLQTTCLEVKGTSGAVQTIAAGVNIKSIQGNQFVLDNPNLQGSAAANPVEQTYFILYTWDSSGTTGTANCDVQIDFNATFTEPRVLSPSIVAQLHTIALNDAKASSSKEVKDDGVVVNVCLGQCSAPHKK